MTREFNKRKQLAMVKTEAIFTSCYRFLCIRKYYAADAVKIQEMLGFRLVAVLDVIPTFQRETHPKKTQSLRPSSIKDLSIHYACILRKESLGLMTRILSICKDNEIIFLCDNKTLYPINFA